MEGFFIDVQGTLIDDKEFLPLPGSIEFIDYLNTSSIPYILITNNTKKSSEGFKRYLYSIGFKFKNYIDPLMVLDETVYEKNIRAYGNEKFLNVLHEKGYKTDCVNPESVILGIKLYSADELGEILEYLLSGSKLIGMHRTSIYSKNGKRYPGLGAVLEMLKYAADAEYVTIGKPSKSFFDRAARIIGLNYDKITIISDDLKGDLLPAKKMGMKTALVLSGKLKNRSEINKNPDFIFDNLKKALEYWRDNGKKTY